MTIQRPEPGLCLPCVYRHCRDGDTVVVSVPDSDREWAIRLINCWAPDRGEPGYEESKKHAEDIMDQCDDLYVYIPAPKHTVNLLKNLTFDRVPGYIFVNTQDTLNTMMVQGGHATKEKSK